MSDKLPHVEVHEAMCKSIGDMAKENEALKAHINRLEEAGDALCTTMLRESKYLHGENFKASINVWRKAKEDKP